MERIVASVMDGSYRFVPVHRHYIPKPDGRKRPLGIPTTDDKLVQAAAKIMLEYVYEPIFSDRSQGFRKGHSCHSALEQIKYGWSGVKWLVEVDVSGFFDNVDHDIFVNLLRKRIDDERFIALISRMLKAGRPALIIGQSGCGKSTLAKLASGLYAPDSGHIFANGNDMAEHDPRSVRQTIAYLPQEAELFAGTIRVHAAQGPRIGQGEGGLYLRPCRLQHHPSSQVARIDGRKVS